MLQALTQWHWLALAVILFIAEVLVGGGFLLWIGISALIVGLLEWIFPTTLTWGLQMLLFAVFGVLNCVLWWLYLRRHPSATDEPKLNRRSEAVVGRTFELSEPIVNGRGKIHAGDTSWLVTGPDLPVGAKVKVISADGTLLHVKAVVEEHKEV